MKSTRNKNAGKHPSYDKRGMSKAARLHKLEYDKKHGSSDEQKEHRADCNKERAKAKKRGAKLKGKDIAHTSKGIRIKSIKANRGSKTDTVGDKKARG